MSPWDCTIDNEKAPSGVYIYKVFATGADGVRHHLSGTINVLY